MISRSFIRVFVLTLTVILSHCLPQAQGHFIWVYGDDGKVKVVFGEGLSPDKAQFLKGLGAMKAHTFVHQKPRTIEFQKQIEGPKGWFEIPQQDVGPIVNIGCKYGVFGRGEKSMLLDYSAKYVQGFDAIEGIQPSSELGLDLVPSFHAGQLVVTAYFGGKPVKDVEVKIESVATQESSVVTDKNGVGALSPNYRYVVRGKYSVQESGTFEGQEYSHKNFYCTLVMEDEKHIPVSTNANASQHESDKSWVITKVQAGLADFPRGMTSFGATVLDDKIFVIGGKSGKAHSYAKAYQNRNVYCLDLKSGGKKWETVGENLGLQGLAIVGHQGKVYRIGGLEARNKEGDDQDLHSIAEVLEFDTQSQEWKEFPKLPQGRSSFDATICNDRIYVAGGWKMSGEGGTQWANDALVLDLSDPTGGWKAFETPFETRACAVRALNEKLFVIGGIESGGGPTADVHVFDLASKKWSEGPAIPTASGMKAFGCSAVVLQEKMLVSTYQGEVFLLSDDMTKWELVHQLENGRFFHQMLPVDNNKFAMVGGSHMENGSQLQVEVFEFLSNSK